ncbi:MAG TPA: hypothetical protein VJU17_09400, partial [Gemmatimonadales bacterium]|nr:hypothetical protein [Gemmatimonadales bacterium]
MALLAYSEVNRLLAVMFTERGDRIRLSALGPRLVANTETMKKPRARRSPRTDPDDILPEYDFSKGRRN